MGIPNVLSLLRLAMVPAFVAVFFTDSPHAHRYAGLIFIIASMTDALDGYIARKRNMITKLGRILDPLADKLMTAAAIICITIADIVPVWIFIVFAVKELIMAVGTVIMLKRIDDVLPSNILGKTATVTFFIFCVALMMFDIRRPYSTIMLSTALAFTLLALVRYAIRFYYTTIRKDAQKQQDQ